MVGISSYGAYIPMLRLPLAAISGGGSQGEQRRRREGGRQLRRRQRHDGGRRGHGLPARHRSQRGRRRAVRVDHLRRTRRSKAPRVIAKALDLRRDVATADFGGSLRAGTARCAPPSTRSSAGSARNVLVIASDCRLAAPRSALERSFGDGAAAFLVGDADVAAAILAPARHRRRDHRRLARRRRSVRALVGRPLRGRARLRANVGEVVARLAREGRGERQGLRASVVLYGPDARSHAAAARALRLDPKTQVQDALFGRLGNAGAAFAPLLLVAALENAEARATSCCSRTTATAPTRSLLAVAEPDRRKLSDRRGVRWHLERRAELDELRQVPAASASCRPASTTAAPAPACRRPSTSATATRTSAFTGRSAASAARCSSRSSASASPASRKDDFDAGAPLGPYRQGHVASPSTSSPAARTRR